MERKKIETKRKDRKKMTEEKGKKMIVGPIGTRGRIFQGKVTKKFGHRVVVEFDRIVRVPKYERFTKKKTKLHARVPEGVEVHVGGIVKVRECRPLSKIVRFIIIEVLDVGGIEK